MTNHLKTKINLDTVESKDKDLRSSFTDNNMTKDGTGNCDVCNTSYNKKNKHNEPSEHKENVKQKKKLADGMLREKLMS